MNIELIGFAAGIIILCAHFPQIIKSLKTKKTNDISLILYCMIGTGMFLWLLYGYLKPALAVMVMNSIAICAVSTMIILKLKYGMKRIGVENGISKR